MEYPNIRCRPGWERPLSCSGLVMTDDDDNDDDDELDATNNINNVTMIVSAPH